MFDKEKTQIPTHYLYLLKSRKKINLLFGCFREPNECKFLFISQVLWDIYFTFKSVFILILLQVPEEFTFLQVVDLYFKIHFIFSVPFEPSLSQFMGVFEKHVYGIDGDTNLSPTVLLKAKAVFALDNQTSGDV